MKSSTSKRLKQIMNERNLKQVDILEMSKPFQKKLGIKMGKSTLSQYVNGVQSPDQHRIYLLSKTLNVSEPWLMGFDVTRERIPDNERNDEKIPSNITLLQKEEFINVPILGEIACGDPILANENIIGYRYHLKDTLPKGNTFYLKAKGDSMEPRIPNGADVLIRQQDNVENGEIAAVLVNGDTEATLKRIYRQGENINLVAENPAYPPYIVNEENPARILGKAIEVSFDL